MRLFVRSLSLMTVAASALSAATVPIGSFIHTSTYHTIAGYDVIAAHSDLSETTSVSGLVATVAEAVAGEMSDQLKKLNDENKTMPWADAFLKANEDIMPVGSNLHTIFDTIFKIIKKSDV